VFSSVPYKHLSIDDGGHPEPLAGPGDRQHGPEEDTHG